MNIRPIAMRCDKHQFEEIRPILESNKFDVRWNEGRAVNYLINNYMGILGDIRNLLGSNKFFEDRTVFEEWNKDIFLEYCGLKLPEKWCVKATPETAPILGKFWDDSIKKKDVYSKWHKNLETNYWHSHNLANGNSMFGDFPGANYTDQVMHQGFTEITFEQFSQFYLKEKTETKMYKIKGSDMKSLYDTISKTCSWNKRVYELYGKNMLDDTICEVSESLYGEAYRDANSSQRQLLEKLLPKVLDFSILNDEDVFYMEVYGYKYIFKGQDPFGSKVKGINCDTNTILENIICSKYLVDLLRKATKEEEAKYYSFYPKFNVGDYVYVISGGNGALGADGKVGQIVHGPIVDKRYNGEHKPLAKIFVEFTDSVWGLAEGYELRLATEDEIKSICPFKDGEYIVVWDHDGCYYVRKSNGKRVNGRDELYSAGSDNVLYTYNYSMSLKDFNEKYNG